MINCPKCGVGLELPNDSTCTKVKCVECGEKFVVSGRQNSIDAECPHCHALYEVTLLELGTTAVCAKCNRKFKIAKRQLSHKELLAQQIKAWEQENKLALELWKHNVALWEKRMEEQTEQYQKQLSAYETGKMDYVNYLQAGGLLGKYEDEFEFTPKRGEVVYRRVLNVVLEESRGVRRTESHRSSRRDVDWGYDYNGRNRRLGDSYKHDGWSESKTEYEFQPIDRGNVYVTNQRFLFFGQHLQRNTSLDKILSSDFEECYSYSCIKVRAENRQRVMCFTGENLFEFAIVMESIRNPVFRNFLLSGSKEEVRAWLDDHGAFPNWIIPEEPHSPKFPPKPEMPRPSPRPTLQPNRLFRMVKTICCLFGGLVKAMHGDKLVNPSPEMRKTCGLPEKGRVWQSELRQAIAKEAAESVARRRAEAQKFKEDSLVDLPLELRESLGLPVTGDILQSEMLAARTRAARAAESRDNLHLLVDLSPEYRKSLGLRATGYIRRSEFLAVRTRAAE